MFGYRKKAFLFGVTLFIFSLTACCGKQMVDNLVTWENLKVDVINENDIYKVYLNAARDCLCDFDANKKEDRLRAMNLLFEGKCKSVEVLDEEYVHLMLYDAWAMKIKCRR